MCLLVLEENKIARLENTETLNFSLKSIEKGAFPQDPIQPLNFLDPKWAIFILKSLSKPPIQAPRPAQRT